MEMELQTLQQQYYAALHQAQQHQQQKEHIQAENLKLYNQLQQESTRKQQAQQKIIEDLAANIQTFKTIRAPELDTLPPQLTPQNFQPQEEEIMNQKQIQQLESELRGFKKRKPEFNLAREPYSGTTTTTTSSSSSPYLPFEPFAGATREELEQTHDPNEGMTEEEIEEQEDAEADVLSTQTGAVGKQNGPPIDFDLNNNYAPDQAQLDQEITDYENSGGMLHKAVSSLLKSRDKNVAAQNLRTKMAGMTGEQREDTLRYIKNNAYSEARKYAEEYNNNTHMPNIDKVYDRYKIYNNFGVAYDLKMQEMALGTGDGLLTQPEALVAVTMGRGLGERAGPSLHYPGEVPEQKPEKIQKPPVRFEVGAPSPKPSRPAIRSFKKQQLTTAPVEEFKHLPGHVFRFNENDISRALGNVH
jgi:hypothetical protein